MQRIIIIALLIITVLISSCINREANIKSEIEKAKYCEINEDCVKVDAWCPFGCSVYVNKAEADRIQELIDSFKSNCQYRCQASIGVECKNNKCEPIYN